METNHMDIIELARELGRKIQNEDSYLKFQLAKQAADEDEELQRLIDEFNRKRVELNEETSKEESDRDAEKVRELNREFRSVYAKIMTNERMINYNDAKDGFEAITKRISAIIQQSAEGGDPDTADYVPSSCSGSCASCGGCG